MKENIHKIIDDKKMLEKIDKEYSDGETERI